MIRFAQTCDAIAAVPGTSEKVRLLAEYLAGLGELDLNAAVHFFTGRPFAAADQRALGLGWRTILAAAREVWHVGDEELSENYRRFGDLGSALAPFTRNDRRLALFSERLTPASLQKLFGDIAGASGKNAARKRQALCEQILGACAIPIETKYVVKIMTGELRIGLREGLVLEAIAAAFAADASDVRRAVMASGDAGAAAVAAKDGALDKIGVAYGSPIGFMLASPIAYGSAYRELRTGEWIVESKFDGIRAQLHKAGDRVALFSRTLSEVSHSYPEIVAAAHAIEGSAILDGEIVASRDGQVLPFRYLQARLRRKTIAQELLDEVPVAFMCFDVLARDEEFLVDTPLAIRRERLARVVHDSPHLSVAPFARLANDETQLEPELHRRFDEARGAGHEGLVAKRLDSTYHPGRRGKWWLKLKRELSTLDVVVVAVEWGHGKRASVLSDYTFAVRGERRELLTIGKAYSGLTDAEIATLTPWFLEHRLPSDRQRAKARASEIPVEPEIVLEIAFDIVQKSQLHESGFALRFPRIVRIRDDKPPEEIDTMDRVREIYDAMLAREGLA